MHRRTGAKILMKNVSTPAILIISIRTLMFLNNSTVYKILYYYLPIILCIINTFDGTG